VFAPHQGEPFVLVAADLGWWQRAADERRVREPLLKRLQLNPTRVLFNLSHTHAGPSICADDADKPGGALIEPYLDAVGIAAIEATSEALAAAVDATLEWTVGRSGLAANRDLAGEKRHLVGFNPDEPADDTVLVGRITDGAGDHLITIVNYACHPTTLAWENTLISPDYVGSLRTTVEEATGAPCVFLQGASGELAPREQYVSDTDVPERHGRALGHAVLAALETLPPPRTELRFTEIVESGAPLAIWSNTSRLPPTVADATLLEVPVDLRSDDSLEEIAQLWEPLSEGAATERLNRARRLRDDYGGSHSAAHPIWIWRLGDTAVVAHPGEAYSLLQRGLRQRHPNLAVVVMNVTNSPGSVYFPPRDLYAENAYSAWQTLVRQGSLEKLIEAADNAITNLFD